MKTIVYKDIKRLVRVKEKDNNSTKWSDYDIKQATNEVIRYVSNALALQNADFIEARKKYNEDEINAERTASGQAKISFADDGAEFPDDYVALIALATSDKGKLLIEANNEIKLKPNQFRVFGNKIYTPMKEFVLTYKKSLAEVTNDESVVELPYTYMDAVVSLVRIVLQNDTERLDGAVGVLVDQLVPKRRYRNLKVALPWKV